MTDLMVAARIAPREKFVTIYSGMEVEPFLDSGIHRPRARRQLGYGPEHVVVGKIARLAPLKGHSDLVQAAGLVVQRSPSVRFLLVGDGVLREAIQRQIAAAGLAGHFQFTGLVSPERIPELIAAMDVVVHTSLREGLARVLPQALLAGRPVVSYDVHGAREVVIPGETGYLVPPHNIGFLAEALVQLADDPDLRQRQGRGGRRFVDQFRHQRMTSRVRAVYEILLAGRPSV